MPAPPFMVQFSTGDVQCAQRTAFSGIVDRHCGQVLVVGSAGGPCVSRFICLTTKKMQKATITKSRMLLRNTPYLMAVFVFSSMTRLKNPPGPTTSRSAA